MSIRKHGIKGWNWLFKNATLISMVSIIVLSVIDISNANEWTIKILGVEKFQIGKSIYYLTVISALIFGFFSISNSKEIQNFELQIIDYSEKIVNLESLNEQLFKEKEELFQSYLKLLFSNLDLDHHDRISVYKVEKKCFVLMGRYSENPNFKLPGRPAYPINEGFIGIGWSQGGFYCNDLPDPSHRKGQTYYKAICEISYIDDNTIENMTMKSRTFFIRRMNGYDGNPKAVIVIESLLGNKFQEEFANEKLQGVKTNLVTFIENSTLSNSFETEDAAEKMGLS